MRTWLSELRSLSEGVVWQRVGAESRRHGVMYRTTDGRASIVGQWTQVGQPGRRERVMHYTVFVDNQQVDYAYSLATAKARAEKRLAAAVG